MEITTVAAIFERVPGTLAFKRRLIRYKMLGKTEYPTELPFRRALAVAAAAWAQDCGVRDPVRVYDLLVATPGDVTGKLVVFLGRRGPPRLVSERGFDWSQPATVIDLDRIGALLRGQDVDRMVREPPVS